MMRILHILSVALLLGAMLCGCRPGAAEARLIAIDSLTATAPDSALALLAATDTATLSEADRAYHALLTSQALYKAYIPATDSAAITRAWAYYSHHGPYDRRVRAMIHQGTTAEEMGLPDRAMLHYKQAEDYARPDDHYNRGYILMREGSLLQVSYLVPERAIERYKKAIPCFAKVGETNYHLACVTSIGELYRQVNTDSAWAYIQKGLEFASELNDSVGYWRNKASLAGLYYERKSWSEASQLAMSVIRRPEMASNFDCCLFAVVAYCRQHKMDSARLVISRFEQVRPNNKRDSVMFIFCKTEYERCSGHVDAYLHLDSIYNVQLETAYIDTKLIDVLNVDNETGRLQDSLHQLTSKQKTIIIVSCVLVFLLLGGIVYVFIRYRISKKKRQNLVDAYQELEQEYDKLKRKRQSRARALASADGKALHATCIEMILQRLTFSGEKGVSIVKQFDRLSSQIKDKEKGFNLKKLELNDEFWTLLRQFMCAAYPRTMRLIDSGEIVLNENELKLLSLNCLNIPNVIIALIIEDYSERSVASVKYRIAQKLGGDKDLATTLNQLESQQDSDYAETSGGETPMSQ